MSFKPEVVADSSGQFYGNSLRFATREEAEANVADLKARWLLVTQTRVVESEDPVNYRYVNGRLVEATKELADEALEREEASAERNLR